MFTDQPTTPKRLEVFLEVVWEMRQRKLDREAIRNLFQPKGLPDLAPNSKQSIVTLDAARDLDLVVESEDGSFRPGWNVRKPFIAKNILLSAIDEKVLSVADIEPWFARFYSYVITKEDDIVPLGSDAANRWSIAFNRDLYSGQAPKNPFNPDKYSKQRVWLRYAGLGWYDAKESFIPNPYDRVRRKLEDIFEKKNRLSSDVFMANLAIHCPELDGGAIFLEVNSSNLNRTCTRALATALRDLHDDRVIKLDCPADSRGWSLIRAGVIRNPQEGLYSDEFDHVELVR